MKVLIACEYSGVVRDAFLAEGHDAISCDLLPTESPGPHIQGDVRPLLKEPWDLVVAHPPCTYLSGARGAFPNELREKQAEAMVFFMDCYAANAPMVAVENPLTYRSVRKTIGQHHQVVQPFHFGEGYRKYTCLWLKGLPPLMSTVTVPNPIRWMTGTGVTPTRETPKGKERAKFFPGIAKAMAQQWGSYESGRCFKAQASIAH